MSTREIETGLAEESRELAAMLYTRNQYLKDHLASLMGLICHYDAALHHLAGLSGGRGGRVLRNLETALEDLDRDGLLKDMMQMLEKSTVEAAELEEIASAQHALCWAGTTAVNARTWAREVSGQVRSLSRGRVQARWVVADTTESSLFLPPILPDLLASALRSLAEQATGASLLEGRIEADESTARITVELGPAATQTAEKTWEAAPSDQHPVAVRMACCLFRTRGGWLEVQSPVTGATATGLVLRVGAQMPLASAHSG